MENGIKRNSNSYTVNSNKEYITTVNSLYSSKVKKVLEELEGNPMGIALELADKLDDKESVDYYKILAMNSPVNKLFEALSFTLDAERRGRIRTKKAIYFQAILKKWGIKTKWKA